MPVVGYGFGDSALVVALSVSRLRDALATGAYDGHLPALRAAELAGAGRKGALAAINERAATLAQGRRSSTAGPGTAP
jgi:hypothetical protein